MQELVQDTDISVVIITTPPSTHYDLCKISLEHGKNVVVEKPFTPSLKEADLLITLAKKQQRLLTVYQNRRWDADFLQVSKYIKDGVLGRVVEFETHFDRHRPAPPSPDAWKTKPSPGTGAIYDLGVHLLDQIVTLFGLPKSVSAFLRTQREGAPTDVHDSFTILLHYDTGLMATAKAGVVSLFPEQPRFRVSGEQGTYQKYNLDDQERSSKAGLRPSDRDYASSAADKSWAIYTTEKLQSPLSGDREEHSIPDGSVIWKDGGVLVKPDENWLTFYKHFASALAGQGEVPVTPEDASNIIRLIELAKLSSEKRMTLEWDKKYEEFD